jgi:plastocyanin
MLCGLRFAGCLVLAGCLVFPSGLVFAGDLSGRVVITRKLTRKPVNPATYNIRGVVPREDGPQPVVDEFARTVVLLEGGTGTGTPRPVRAVLDQRGRRFQPELLVVPAGSTVDFPNSDPLFHNVFSLSRAKSFDLGYYPEGRSRSVTFPRPGVVQVYCHLHPNMYAAIVVTAGDRHRRPAEDGQFSWKDLPAGDYEVVVWHNTGGLFRKRIRVPERGEARLEIHVPVDRDPPAEMAQH